MSDNSTLLLFTDGIAEAWNEDEEQLGVERLESIIEEASAGDAPLLESIYGGVKAYIGDRRQEDDMTMMSVCRAQ